MHTKIKNAEEKFSSFLLSHKKSQALNDSTFCTIDSLTPSYIMIQGLRS